jgi:hypothetical protein
MTRALQQHLVTLCRKHNAPIKDAWEAERLDRLAKQIQDQQATIDSMEHELIMYREAGNIKKAQGTIMHLGKEKKRLELLKTSTNSELPSWAYNCTPIKDETIMDWFRFGYDPAIWDGVNNC